MSIDVDVLSWLDEVEPVKPAISVRKASTDTLISPQVEGTCFEINREVLLHLLEKAINVVPTRDIIPVYTNFQFDVVENYLQVIATNGEISIKVCTSQVATKVSGKEIFPARTLMAIIKEAANGSTVFFEMTATGVVIVAGNFSSEIGTMFNADFPEIDPISDVNFHEVDRAKFIEALSSVKYALPGKDFGGISALKFVNIKHGKFTACDSDRFQQVRIDGFNLNMQLPADSINSLIKALSSTTEQTLYIGETLHRLVFKLDNLLFYINKMGNAYPNVEQLWLRPALSNDQELLVDRQELLTAIKQAKTSSDTDSNALALVIDSNNIEIRIRSLTKSALITIGCEWQGKPRTLVVNYLHLAEMLKAYDNPVCKFLLGKDTKTHKAPILLKNDDTMAIATIAQMISYPSGLVD